MHSNRPFISWGQLVDNVVTGRGDVFRLCSCGLACLFMAVLKHFTLFTLILSFCTTLSTAFLVLFSSTRLIFYSLSTGPIISTKKYSFIINNIEGVQKLV